MSTGQHFEVWARTEIGPARRVSRHQKLNQAQRSGQQFAEAHPEHVVTIYDKRDLTFEMGCSK